MLTYSMDGRGTVPLYEYLYRCIRDDILSGRLVTEEKLPSRRALAEHLHVSVITVEGAYRQLEAEGYVTSRPRRGVFVNRIESRPRPRTPAPQPLPAETRPLWRLDLASNQVDASRFPVATLARLTRQILSEGSEALLTPVPHQGLFSLRQAVAEDLREYRGLSVSPEQIVIGAGAEYLYLLVAQLLGRDTVMALEDPGYPKIRQVYEKCGLRCVSVPLDRKGIDPGELYRAGVSAVHLSPNHQYPTGITTPVGRRHVLLQWAEQTGGFLIEDDYDSEFRFSGRPIPSLQSIDTSGRVIYLNTFSQTISPAMRLGFMVLPPDLLERYRRELNFYSCTVPALDQHILCRFLAGGHYEQHLSRMRKEYRNRRTAVLDAFRHSAFSDRISIHEQGAGLHFLLRLDTREEDASILRRAEAMGVHLSFLSRFAHVPRKDFAHTLVVNYPSLSPDFLLEAMNLLDRALFPQTGSPSDESAAPSDEPAAPSDEPAAPSDEPAAPTDEPAAPTE